MSSATDHFDTDLSTTCKKIPHYSGELARQMADRFVAPHYFHSVFVHGVIKLSFGNKFFSDQWLPYVLINMISMHSCCEGERCTMQITSNNNKQKLNLNALRTSLVKAIARIFMVSNYVTTS